MDIELIVEIVMLFGVYIVAGMIISYIVNDISYLAYDYFLVSNNPLSDYTSNFALFWAKKICERIKKKYKGVSYVD